MSNELQTTENWTPQYSKYRHGGWYVSNISHENGARGCVSNNFEDKKWRIVCDPRPAEEQETYKTRDAAARAERKISITNKNALAN
jgi:hypothetical protein